MRSKHVPEKLKTALQRYNANAMAVWPELDWAFSERIWLPGEVGWSQLRRGELSYVHTAPWLALLMLLLRSFVLCVAGVVGRACGVPDRQCNPPPAQAVLQASFSSTRRPSAQQEETLARKVGWPPHRVRKWMHRARSCRKVSTLTKFRESSWRFIVYAFSTACGLTVLVKEPYFLDLAECYVGYPSQAASRAAMCYWCLQLALYLSELLSTLTGVVPRKKDFLPLLAHHSMTVALLLICYAVNMVPIGLVIAVLHDVADVFLELAKLLVYVRCSAMANTVFCVFAGVFIATRLVVLPNWVLPSLVYSLPEHTGGHSHVTLAAIALILGLLCLHVYWLSLIAKVVLQMLLKPGCHSSDSRSDSELSSFESN